MTPAYAKSCSELGLVGEACQQHHTTGGLIFFTIVVVGLFIVWRLARS